MKRSADPRKVLADMAAGKSHQAIANEIGVSRSLVQALIAGKREFTDDVLSRIGLRRKRVDTFEPVKRDGRDPARP